MPKPGDKPLTGTPAPGAAAIPLAASAPVVYSHSCPMYGRELEHSLDHHAARVTLGDGTTKTFATKPGDDPSAFLQAVRAAKADWQNTEARDAAAKQLARKKMIDEATERADKARGK